MIKFGTGGWRAIIGDDFTRENISYVAQAISDILIEDGKALLAIDDEQPTRIISTDKKAEKAGGLYLALAGVLVKPTDDIDTDKEYQLIALTDGGGSSDVTPVTPE